MCVLETLSQMERGKSLSQLKRGRYIAPSKLIKPTQTILEKAQQRSILPMVLDNDEVRGFHGG